jgi:hypothetical protein
LISFYDLHLLAAVISFNVLGIPISLQARYTEAASNAFIVLPFVSCIADLVLDY